MSIVRAAKRFSRLGFYVPATLALPILAGLLGWWSTMHRAARPIPPRAAPAEQGAPPVAHDPTKPIVVVLLGDDLTEATDFLGPYEIFSRSGAFNVYALAPEHRPTRLTDGLDVIPTLSLAEFDQRFATGPDILVAPAIPRIKSAENQPIVTWIKRHAGPETRLLSWCAGAAVLAEAGLLDGKSATSHWGDLDRLEKEYPKVRWVRGMRYVDEGSNLITSGGLTAGIDATLHLLARTRGEDFARSLAEELHYPSFGFVAAPRVEQLGVEARDVALVLLSGAYPWPSKAYGVLLYDGVGELELASLLDVHGVLPTTRLLPLAPREHVIRTRNGLVVLPRWSLDDAPPLDRVIVPGSRGRQLLPDGVERWAATRALSLDFLHEGGGARFAYDAPLEDMALRENLPTALLARKRLEYRLNSLHLEGTSWPIGLLARPILLGLVGLALRS